MSERSEGFWRSLKRVDERVAAVAWRVFGWFVVPLLAFGAVWFGAQDLGPAWAAAHGDGQHGVFVVQERQCDRGCNLYGDFTSDDGTVRLHDVLLSDPPTGLQEGDRTPAVYAGGRPPPVVFRESGSWQWLLIGCFLVGGVVVLAVWGLALYARLAHRFLWAP